MLKSGRKWNERRKRKGLVKPVWRVCAVCEGKLENSYFSVLRVGLRDSGVIVQLFGPEQSQDTGDSMVVLDRCIEIKRKKRDIYDEFWCLVDCDRIGNKPAKFFDKARKHKIKLAISNLSFEIWLLLHFEGDVASYKTAQHAKDKCKEIDKRLLRSKSVYEMCKTHRVTAIIRAEAIWAAISRSLSKGGDEYDAYREAVKKGKIFTTVHLLLKALHERQKNC